jgi:hypothetical protein
MNALLNKAIVILQAMPAVKFVIVLPDGATITQGDLQLQKTKQRTRNFKYPVGSVCQYYKPYVADLQVGQMVEIPFDKFDPEPLRSGIASHCSKFWGNGSAMTAINRSKKCVELLRVA